MQKHLISILVPFKNTESYLVECLDSIVNQTYTHWELIIVDDGSTDASYELVKNYADTDARIHLLRNDGVRIFAFCAIIRRDWMNVNIKNINFDSP